MLSSSVRDFINDYRAYFLGVCSTDTAKDMTKGVKPKSFSFYFKSGGDENDKNYDWNKKNHRLRIVVQERGVKRNCFIVSFKISPEEIIYQGTSSVYSLLPNKKASLEDEVAKKFRDIKSFEALRGAFELLKKSYSSHLNDENDSNNTESPSDKGDSKPGANDGDRKSDRAVSGSATTTSSFFDRPLPADYYWRVRHNLLVGSVFPQTATAVSTNAGSNFSGSSNLFTPVYRDPQTILRPANIDIDVFIEKCGGKLINCLYVDGALQYVIEIKGEKFTVVTENNKKENSAGSASSMELPGLPSSSSSSP